MDKFEALNKLRQGFESRAMSDGRITCLEQVKSQKLEGDIYTFGVCAGYSLLWIHQWLKKNNVKYHRYWGFDSFEGLPDEFNNLPVESSWKKGGYSVQEEWGCTDLFGAKDLIQSFFNKYDFYPGLIQGFFCDSLDDNFLKNCKPLPALIIDMDCDLYISCKQALTFMTKCGLIIAGTVIYYDDWFGVKEFSGGESLAHQEWCLEFGIKGRFLCKNPDLGAGFWVTSINNL